MLSNRTRGDDGVVAVLSALLVAFVLLPVAALGLTSYVRAGVAEEMQRAADAGALAAATSLLFVDVDGLDLRSDGAKLVTGPACPAAKVSLGDSWTPRKESAPLSAAFAATTPVSCSAAFSLDDAYPQCITHLVANAQAVLDASVEAAMRVVDALAATSPVSLEPVVDPLLGTATTVVQPVSATATDTTALTAVVDKRVALAQRVFALVPAAQSDGIVVRLAHEVQGPLDGLLLRNDPSSKTATSTSRRLFKPLLPTSQALTQALSSPVAAADPELGEKLATTLDDAGQPHVSQVERDVVEVLQGLLVTTADAVVAAGMTIEGAEDAVAEQLSEDEVLRTQLRSLREQFGAAAPLVPASVLDLMLAEPLPTVRLNPLDPDCQAAASELVRALARALQLNDDQDDLTSCLTGQLLGLPGARAPQARACIAGLFRAQLRPDPTQTLPQVLP